jgi:hypothetical protein
LESSFIVASSSTIVTEPFLIPSPTYICGIDITFAELLKNLSDAIGF